MLNKFCKLFFSSLLISNIFSNKIEIKTQDAKEAPAKIYMGILNYATKEIADLIKQAFEWGDQFIVDIVKCDKPKNINEITRLESDYSLAIFIEDFLQNNCVEWRLYDINDGVILKGKRVNKNQYSIKELAKIIADQLWFELTQQKSCFLTKIAYLAKNKNTENTKSSIYCCDYMGCDQQKIKINPGYYINLSWDLNSNRQRLFCSELARYNVRLISILLNGKKQILFNTKGTHIGISLSNENNTAVYCKSGSIWKYKFDQDTNKIKHKRIIHNDGKNFKPTLMSNKDILFCSDSKTLCKENNVKNSGPKICYFKKSDKSIDIITKNGYCLSPAYSSSNNQIVYIKKIAGFFQLFIFDMLIKSHKQITFDKINKFDPQWSPCGNFIVYCIKSKNSSRIAIININTKNSYVISDDAALYSSPTWA